MDVFSLVPTASMLVGVGIITIQTVGSVHPDVTILVHISVSDVGGHIGPAAWDQNGGGSDVGPATCRAEQVSTSG